MTRTQWLLALLVAAVLAHAAWPRYEWRDPGGDAVTFIRIDRWTGTAQVGQFYNAEVGHISGQWRSFEELRNMSRDGKTKDLLSEADAILSTPTK